MVPPKGGEESGTSPLEPVPLTGRESRSLTLSPSPRGQGGRAQEPATEAPTPVSASGTARTGGTEASQQPQLRPYQREAIAAIEAEFARGVQRTLLVLPTGTGKTVVFAELVRQWAIVDDRTLVLAHRTELLDQAHAKLAAAGVTASIDQADRRGSLSTSAVIASVQTLRGARLQRYAPDAFARIVVDEGHHAAAQSYRAILDRFPTARVLLVTATPDRADGRGLDAICESVAYTYEMRQAIRDGFLAPIRARRVKVADLDLSAVRSHHGDFDQGELAAVLNAEKALHGVAGPLVQLAGARKTLVFGVDVAHARGLAEVLNRHRAGAAMALDGTAPKAQRAAVLSLFAKGAIQFLVNCLDDKTEILTRRGWQGIDTIANDDIAATMNHGIGSLEWQPLMRVVRRDRTPGERMVRISNQSLDVRVTEGHRMLVGRGEDRHWDFAEAVTLPGRGGPYWLPTAALGAPDEISALTLDECRFIGLFITDGHLDRSAGHRGIVIGQSERFPAHCEAVERILTACRFDWRVTSKRVRNSRHRQRMYSVPKGSIGGKLHRRGFMRVQSYLDKDLLPALVTNLNRDQARALFEGLWLGDGVKEHGRKHRNDERRSWAIVNTNRTLLERVQILAVTRGFAANLSAPRDNGPLATKPIYTLRIRDRAYVGTNNHTIATSGGNPARFESEWRAERVWCVTTANGTVITRRNGKVLVMGQCALFTEGFDEPSIECVAMARPTQSRALYTQMVGRGTRLSPGKTDVLVLDFVGNSGRHKLIGPADALAGRDVDEQVRDAIERELEGGQRDLEAVLEHAEAEAAARRAEVSLVAVSHYRLKEVDPFVGEFLPKLDPYSPAARAPASEAQLAALEKWGFSKPPPGLTKGEASAMLDGAAAREKAGLSTIAQCRFLARYGVPGEKLTKARAGQLFAIVRARGFHMKFALARQPEFRGWSR